jgi:hypothetical protein
MKAWSYWYPDLMIQLVGCPQPVMDFELRRASQAFFQATRAWQVTLPALAVIAAQEVVPVVLADAGTELIRVEKAWYNGSSITPSTADALDAQFSDDWTLHTGTPDRVYQVTPGDVHLYPIPTEAPTTGLKLRVSVRPSETATGLADDMAIKFRDDIANGAKARLMMYPNVEWSNPQLAMMNMALFDAATGKTNLAAARSFGAARQAASPKWC